MTMVYRLDLRLDLKKNTMTVQATKLQTHCTTLLKHILKFQKIQQSFRPGLCSHLEENTQLDRLTELNSTPERIPLYLPSSWPNKAREKLCSSTIVDIENQLQYAQAHDALAMLC